MEASTLLGGERGGDVAHGLEGDDLVAVLGGVVVGVGLAGGARLDGDAHAGEVVEGRDGRVGGDDEGLVGAVVGLGHAHGGLALLGDGEAGGGDVAGAGVEGRARGDGVEVDLDDLDVWSRRSARRFMRSMSKPTYSPSSLDSKGANGTSCRRSGWSRRRSPMCMRRGQTGPDQGQCGGGAAGVGVHLRAPHRFADAADHSGRTHPSLFQPVENVAGFALNEAVESPFSRCVAPAAAKLASRKCVCETVVGMLMLIDAASLWYRAYYGLPSSIKAPDGRRSGAVRGFFDGLAVLARKYSPTGMVCCLEGNWRPEWRMDLMPGYKADAGAAGRLGGHPGGLGRSGRGHRGAAAGARAWRRRRTRGSRPTT